MNLNQIELDSNAEYFTNGQEVIDRVKETFSSFISNEAPIDALLLDFQMPVKNGLEVVTEVKAIYKEFARRYP